MDEKKKPQGKQSLLKPGSGGYGTQSGHAYLSKKGVAWPEGRRFFIS
jgi:hypothetical protein